MTDVSVLPNDKAVALNYLYICVLILDTATKMVGISFHSIFEKLMPLYTAGNEPKLMV